MLYPVRMVLLPLLRHVVDHDAGLVLHLALGRDQLPVLHLELICDGSCGRVESSRAIRICWKVTIDRSVEARLVRGYCGTVRILGFGLIFLSNYTIGERRHSTDITIPHYCLSSPTVPEAPRCPVWTTSRLIVAPHLHQAKAG